MLVGVLTNHTMLVMLMAVLIVFIVLITALAVVFVSVLRKRQPIVKIVMAPPVEKQSEPAPALSATEVAPALPSTEPTPALDQKQATPALSEAPAMSEPVVDDDEDEDDEDDEVEFISETQERVRYNRSFTAKLAQLKNEPKDWYTKLKNELLSYKKVRDRMSWKRENYFYGRSTVARLVVRGKTLCLLLALDPAGFAGTKYPVEDISATASLAATPAMIRIRSDRRVKYACEVIGMMMGNLGTSKQAREAVDYFVPYDGTLGLMQRGLIKRVVSGKKRVYRVEELTEEEAEAEQAARAEAEAEKILAEEAAAESAKAEAPKEASEPAKAEAPKEE